MGSNLIIDIAEIPQFIESQNLESKISQMRNVVLFLGETGKGKSTLTDFLTDNQELRAEGNPGAYIIVNNPSIEKSRISDSQTSFISKTIFPYPIQLKDDNEKSFYLDCPGFRDTRSSSMDISCTIFTKKVLQKCQMAKIVFVLTYEDVVVGRDRRGFLDMVRQAGEFITNLEKFVHSIALFVTKVPWTSYIKDGKTEDVSDSLIQENIVQYMDSVEKYIMDSKRDGSIPKEKEVLYENALKMIKYFIGSNRKQPHVGIFRTPKQHGRLREMKEMIDCKAALNNIIKYGLKYTAISQNDFGYSMSAESKEYVSNCIPKILENIAGIYDETVKKFIRIYEFQEESERNIEELAETFAEEHSIWANLLKSLQTLTNTLEIHKKMLAHTSTTTDRLKPYICTSEDTLDSYDKKTTALDSFAELLGLLETVANKRFNLSAAPLFAAFKKAADFLYDAKTWYINLPKIFDDLLAYHTQKEKSAEITSLLNFPETGIDSKSFYQLLYEITDKKWEEIPHITPVKLSHFKRLCEISIQDPLCEPQKDGILIKGNCVSLSSALVNLTSKVKKLKVFAAYKVFIDCDFVKIGGNFELTICSPEWEVVGGKRRIILDGIPAEDDETSAKSGKTSGSDGEDGVAGKPGGNGGHFLGLGFKIMNHENLKISVCGGRGGKGQAGGDGADGRDGDDAEFPEDQSKWIWEDDVEVESDNVVAELTTTKGFLFFTRKSTQKICQAYGENGDCGGDGGDGGKGGAGGYPGTASWMGFKSSFEPKIVIERGSCGEDGEGGQAGKGGSNGRTAQFAANVDESVFDLFDWTNQAKFDNMRLLPRGKANDGSPGRKGLSNAKLREPADPRSRSHGQNTLVEYLDWVLNEIDSHPWQKYLEEFLAGMTNM